MVQHRSVLTSAMGFVTAALLLVGCSAKSDVPVGEAAENIQMLALGYVEFAAANRGVGPTDKESLAKFLAQRNNVSVEEAEAYFVSPRDNQPYVVRWGVRPMGSGLIGPDPSKRPIIIFEDSGADGTRYVADGQMSIRELSEEAFTQAVPDHQPSGS